MTYIYDLVAIDVDGTLVNSHSKISVEIPPLLREVQARGIGVTLVSGRPKLTLMPILAELELTLPYISSGGAFIIDPAKGAIIDQHTLGHDIVAVIVGLARTAQVAIITQEPERLYFEGDPAILEMVASASKIDLTQLDNKPVEIRRVADILQVCSEPNKITLCGDPTILADIEAQVRERRLPVYPTYSAPTYLEMTSAGINKGSALKRLAAYLHIPVERILVIGDSLNDTSMFEIAGMAVAMGNAPEEVKAAAKLIAPSNDENGVAWVLRELVLKATHCL
ncbi:MAG TPA: Cof-type HAD-IIB family hydrolase [Ktedonobacteraceae bacterium]|nr:Cof-type HAD-IIB family hydrolase [Ktedonobacteraceae bacterium]